MGDVKTCTITNDDIAPQLTVIKHVINDNGGSATATAFTMTVTGSSPSPASFPGAESPGTAVSLNAGSYSVNETGPGGYASSQTAGCSGSMNVGDVKTCTITNDDIAPQLTVIKHVINDNGGSATATAFTMTVTGSSPSPASFPGAESPGTMVSLNAGSYSVNETGPGGYASSQTAGCSGSMNVGDVKTCTITNDDIAPQLTVIKHVINDNGGSATATAFTMTVTGSSPSPASFPGAESPGTVVSLNAGSYSVNETGPGGYASSQTAGCSGSMNVGDVKTCTITNDDIAPQLTVIKHVINDNGGSATATAFTMTVTGSSPSPASFPGAESPGTVVSLNAGSYSVNETGPGGYASSQTAGCSGSMNVGDVKTCTITNDDIAPQLTVIKHVINDNGGSATATAFTMTVTGSSPSPASFPGAESPGTAVTLNAGSYSVNETGPGGYASSQTAGCSGSMNVGDVKTCTITNNDIAPATATSTATSTATATGTATATVTSAPMATSTATNSPTNTATPCPQGGCPTNTPTPTPDPNAAPVRMVKDTNGDVAEPIDLANLWLCKSPAPCTNNGEGHLDVAEMVLNVGGDPDGVGAFEFQVKYDNHIFDIQICEGSSPLNPDGSCAAPVPGDPQHWLYSTGRVAGAPGIGGCAATIITENDIRFGCVSKNPADGNGNPIVTTGVQTDGIAATIHLLPKADLVNRMTPGNNNGAIRTVLDEGCEVADIWGHPLSTGQLDALGREIPLNGILPGGLVADCADVTVTVRILEGDMNLDCAVTVADDQIEASHFGAFFGSLLYQPWYDLEPAIKDGDVDIKDLQKVFGRNGSICAAPVPPQDPQPTP